jgi:protease I
MMNSKLTGMTVAILVADGFEQVELTEPRKALDAAGAGTKVVSPAKGLVRGWEFTNWGKQIPVDVPLDEARPEDFAALLLPGGVMNPDTLRIIPSAIAFIKAFVDKNKPIASICHGPWTLIEVGAAAGRQMTSWPSLRTDLRNAGAQWIDEEVIKDKGIVTSRKPDDLPAFNREMINLFAEARGQTSRAA